MSDNSTNKQKTDIGDLLSNFVTHRDLDDFRSEVKGYIGGLREDFKELSNKISSVGKTNWGVVAAFLTIAVIISGMAGALVQSSVSNEQSARQQGDQELRSAIESERRFQEVVTTWQQKARDEETARVDAILTKNSKDLDDFDIMLQREMRLLDEILQRELGLHVARLEDLIQVNTKAIEELKNLQKQNQLK